MNSDTEGGEDLLIRRRRPSDGLIDSISPQTSHRINAASTRSCREHDRSSRASINDKTSSTSIHPPAGGSTVRECARIDDRENLGSNSNFEQTFDPFRAPMPPDTANGSFRSEQSSRRSLTHGGPDWEIRRNLSDHHADTEQPTVTSSLQKERPQQIPGTEGIGAFRADGRAFGERPAWQDEPNEQFLGDEGSDDDIDPLNQSYRAPEASFSHRTTETMHAMVRRAASQKILPGEDDGIISRRKLLTFFSILLVFGVVVGVTVPLINNKGGDPTSLSGSNTTADLCDMITFDNFEEFDVFQQCTCFGEILFVSPGASSKYERLQTVIADRLSLNESRDVKISACNKTREIILWDLASEKTIRTDTDTIERYALAVLYSNLNVDTEIWKYSEVRDKKTCDWYGVECGSNGTAVSISLSKLHGFLSKELGLLTNLGTFLRSAWYVSMVCCICRSNSIQSFGH